MTAEAPASAAPAGTTRPARGPVPAAGGGLAQTGAVTVEAAVTLLGLALVLTVLVWFLVVLGVQLRANDAARAAARLAARAQPYADVRDEAHRVAPGVSVELSREASAAGERVVVVVRQRLSPPLGPFSGVGGMDVSARATALLETP